MSTARAFAPASVSNVACGFDAFGFAIAGPGDEVEAGETRSPGVEIERIEGDDGQLPLETAHNTAGVAATAVLQRIASRRPEVKQRGVRLVIRKRMPLSSGLGSSAASAVAAAVAVDALLAGELSQTELLRAALAGERLSSGSEHADNVAPSLLGGFVLVRSLVPDPDLVRLPVPEGLTCALVRPRVAVNTLEARELLGDTVPLTDAVRQWSNTAALVAALYSGDLGLLGRSLEDAVAEPRRASLVPGFAAIKQAALDHGGLGCSLSGSGPTIFALAAEPSSAERVADAMLDAATAAGLEADRWTTPVEAPGARVLSEGEATTRPVAG